MPQRDPFASLADVPAEPLEAIPAVLARKPSQAKRDRRWEQEHPVTAVRGLPPALVEELRRVATQLGVSKDEVIRAFLEYGLQAYRNGALNLNPELKVGKLTLYPTVTPERGKRK
jgi:hypothetical protein